MKDRPLASPSKSCIRIIIILFNKGLTMDINIKIKSYHAIPTHPTTSEDDVKEALCLENNEKP
jgi:hypothetical protein